MVILIEFISLCEIFFGIMGVVILFLNFVFGINIYLFYVVNGFMICEVIRKVFW